MPSRLGRRRSRGLSLRGREGGRGPGEAQGDGDRDQEAADPEPERSHQSSTVWIGQFCSSTRTRHSPPGVRLQTTEPDLHQLRTVVLWTRSAKATSPQLAKLRFWGFGIGNGSPFGCGTLEFCRISRSPRS
jgi:hypothetical protein